ncbi:alkaline phosphatase [Streptomyces azureus]|uniref:Alkaline phosphatase n=1 Tax=Streptomyces azureus TaxID=146537 RepID=A0A0K8PHL1_STRAJ|nr:alkaline phosphatase [Streptomyces azureus]
MALTGRQRPPSEHAFSPHDAVLRTAAPHVARRRFLNVTAAAAMLAFTTNRPARGATAAPELDAARITDDPFILGVASGDPLPDSVLIWTRLAPEPFAEDGGLGRQRVVVYWEVAMDEWFAFVEHRGGGHRPSRVRPQRARRRQGSDAGQPLLLPVPGGRLDQPHGPDPYGTGSGQRRRQHAAGRRGLPGLPGRLPHRPPASGAGGRRRGLPPRRLPVRVRRGLGRRSPPLHRCQTARRVQPEATTLADYRLRHALYKTDPDLRAAHAQHPFVVTWDDHETENNYAGAIDERNSPQEEFLVRRAAAYRAYWENQPLRAEQLPQGPDAQLYRRLAWGSLAQFDVLDTRQYRFDQAYNERPHAWGAESDDPARTLTGAEQERWLLDGWRASGALWNVMPQQVCFSQRKLDLTVPARGSMDAWDGYRASRNRVMAGAKAAGIDNWIVLTGDVHVGYAFDIKDDFDDPQSRTVGTEFTCTSLASGGNGAEKPADWDTYMKANPHMKYFDGRRGYVRVELGRENAQGDFRTVSAITKPGGAPSRRPRPSSRRWVRPA